MRPAKAQGRFREALQNRIGGIADRFWKCYEGLTFSFIFGSAQRPGKEFGIYHYVVERYR
jgi:hypothetical protein